MMPWVDGKIELKGFAKPNRESLVPLIVGVVEGGSDALAGAIYEEMEEIKAKSQEIVPLRFGTLRSSADAVGVNLQQSGLNGYVAIGYGGAASAYSIIQHQTPPPGEGDGDGEEGLRFRHAPGRTYKYLEGPVLDAVEGMDARLAAKVRARLAAG